MLADHFALCKFDSRVDPGYRRVMGFLKKHVERVRGRSRQSSVRKKAGELADLTTSKYTPEQTPVSQESLENSNLDLVGMFRILWSKETTNFIFPFQSRNDCFWNL